MNSPAVSSACAALQYPVMKTVRAAFAEFCAPATYARFVDSLRKLATYRLKGDVSHLPMEAWQLELWATFTRSTGMSLPDCQVAIFVALSDCPVHDEPLCAAGPRRGMGQASAEVPLPELCIACWQVSHPDPSVTPLARELIARWGISTFERFVRLLERVVATGRPMLRSQHERWLAFARATPRSLPDAPSALLRALQADSSCSVC